MFEGLNLKKDLVEYESQRLKERVRAVSYTHLTLPTKA